MQLDRCEGPAGRRGAPGGGGQAPGAGAMAPACCCYSEYLQALRAPDEEGGECPTVRVAEMLAGKWRLKILFRLSLAPSMRFVELRESIAGITGAMLTTALRELEGYGVVSRRQYNEVPPRVEYSLTESGRELYPIFYEMARWGAAHLRG